MEDEPSTSTSLASTSNYTSDIYEYLRGAELLFLSDKPFTEKQNEITLKMRSILVDWLVEVSEEYKLFPDTLHLSIALLDRFLLAELVPRKSLQLVGISCVLIAAKFEEIYAPDVVDLCYITDNTYSKIDIINMERRILQQLRFNIHQPTACTFVRHYASLDACSTRNEFLSLCICEIALLDWSISGCAASMIAATSILLSSYILCERKLHRLLQIEKSYAPAHLKTCALNIRTIVLAHIAPKSAVMEKYSQPKFGHVAQELSRFSWEFPDELWT